MKVSVVIAAYNHEKYVEQAIESVLGQTFGDFEIILIDDASQDRTFERAQQIRDPRLQCARARQNRGVSATYNACIERASGEYIAVLNSDDFFALDKLARQVEVLEARPDVAAVFTHADLADEAGLPQRDLPPDWNVFTGPNLTRHAWLRRFFLEGNSLCHPSAMIRKSVHDEVGLYDIRYAQIHDLDLWIRICMKYAIHVIERPLTHFRLRDDQANANNTRPETLTRIDWEYEHVVRRYLDLHRHDDFTRVFPETSLRADEWDQSAQRYALAKAAITGPRPAHQRLALELIHQLFGELGDAEMERRFGLPLNWFLQTTGALRLNGAVSVAGA